MKPSALQKTDVFILKESANYRCNRLHSQCNSLGRMSKQVSVGPAFKSTILPGWITNQFPNKFVPVIFAELITELQSDKMISCNFSEFSFCHFQKRSCHLISQNCSPHATRVSPDGMSVNHPIKVLEPNQNAGSSRIFL